ncbi:MHYT domain-containing protein [Kutzneria viridogrisea]|uniref:NO-binding membrane sensor protein with MHYT domain n=1 Tax=Kutzneria viridogrisea TaxID=47990 RepID=A0ABR6BMM9_9PSEU|nr:NO-binding membrane sensor protein with MHYT domain [Kutzneria viridogrisea]
MNQTDMQHFSMGVWTLAVAYATSVIGSLMGLSCASRARREPAPRKKVLWTVLGALAIGGVAIWLMHFIAMLGFAVTDSPVRYSVPLTALSAVVAVLVVGIGLSMITFGRFGLPRLVLAGVIAGVGVAFMHYLGMAALEFQGEISYDPVLAAVSVVLAVAAATAALWCTVRVRSTAARTGSGLLLAVAVTGMHYTGMAGVAVTVDSSGPAPTGADVFDLVFPVFVISGLIIAGLLWALFTSLVEPLATERAPTG